MRVGDTCEFRGRDTPWEKGTILYVGERFVILRKDGVEIVKCHQLTSFRPLGENDQA